jgi:thioredoxin 1
MRKLSSIIAFAALFSRHVLACPGCKDALSQNGVANPWGSAFNISIIFMLGTVLVLFCGVAYFIYRLSREEERRNGIATDPKATRYHRIGAGITAVFVAVLIFWPSSAGATKAPPVSDLPTLTDETLQTELGRAKGMVVVEVGANWCPPCRMMGPTVSSVAKEMAPAIPFYFVNLDNSPATAKQYKVDELPCLILFKDGKEAGRLIGINTDAGIKELIRKHSVSP